MKTAFRGLFGSKKTTFEQPTYTDILSNGLEGIVAFDSSNNTMTYLDNSGIKKDIITEDVVSGLFDNAPFQLGARYPKYISYFEDFLDTSSTKAAGNGKFAIAANNTEWFVTEVDGGTGQTETELGIVQNDGLGGWGKFATCNADNDHLNAVLNGSSFKLISGKKLWFETRFAIGDVSAVEFFIGLVKDGTTNAYGTAGAGQNDHVGFFNDADGNIDCSVDQDGTQTKADTTANLVDGTVAGAVAGTTNHAHKCGFYWNGAGVITFYIDGVVTNTVTDNGSTIVIPDDEVLTPCFDIWTNTTASAVVFIDYIYVVQER